jgi:ribonuclease BN (tRNA processing enzyme)
VALPAPTPAAAPGVCADPVEVTFLGTQGFWIRRGDDAVLTGPLFTLPKLARVLAGLPVHADTARVRAGLNRYVPPERRGRLRAVVAGHGHYDHFMDVPALVDLFFTRPGNEDDARLRIYANQATLHMLAPAPASLRARLVAVDSLAGDSLRPGAWMYPPGDSTVRMMAVRSQHLPQFLGVKVFQRDQRKPRKTLPWNAWQWAEGQSHALVVEFLDRTTGRVAFRIYYNDTTARPPLGIPAPEGLPGRFDLALVTLGSFKGGGADYPGGILRRTRPRHVLAGHWDDFFQPHTDPPRVLPFQDLDEWRRRVDAELPADATYAMPAPGHRHTFCPATAEG